ncbi:MAG TPA: hypothetical protein DDY54_00405, partial [Deltaproteobacteria bacterium]|nr:hypothetical protein [Deltaproteobacteria bacterium]
APASAQSTGHESQTSDWLQARPKILIHDKKPMKLFAELALTSTGWEKNVRVTIDERGCIAAVESGIEANGEDQQLNGRILLPALANLHSHAFQRAMAGLTEQRLTGRDSFWSWRELM